MDILIKFSFTEKMRLLNHADKVLHGGHWGSSDLIIEEQQVLFKKIEELDGEIELSFYYLKMLIDWIYEGTYGGTAVLAEDDFIIRKIEEAVNKYHSDVKGSYFRDLKIIEETIAMLNDLNPDIKNKFTVESIKNEYNDNLKLINEELKKINKRIDGLQKYFNREVAENQFLKKNSLFAGLKGTIKNQLIKKASEQETVNTKISTGDALKYIEKAEKQAKRIKRKK